MVEKTNTPSDFLAQMMNVQQHYVNNLGQLFQPGQKAGNESPFDAWFSQFPSSGQGGFDEFFRNLAQSSLSIIQNPPADIASLLQSGQLPPGWYDSLQKQFSEWLNADSGNALFEQMNERFRQQLLKPFGEAGAGMGFNPMSMMDSSVLKTLKALFNAEEKLAGENLLKTLEAYQHQVMLMNHMMAQVGIDSIKTLQAQFEDASDTDLKRVYESWKGISEKLFAELKLDDRYRALKTNMNKIEEQLKVDLEQYRQVLIDQLGLVSRQEYDALAKELAELKGQVAGLVVDKASVDPAQSQASDTNSNASAKSSEQADENANDDFSVLNGIGAKFNEKLHAHGVHSLSQLAAMSDEMLKTLDDNLGTNGRMIQQQWREQAEQLVKNMTGTK